jgi:arsenate reductase-like glutaredoxin family protein
MIDKQQLFKEFAKKESRNAGLILSNLGKKQVFIDALNTELGQELLRDLLRLAETKLQKIIDNKETEMDKAIFKVCKHLTAKWTERVNSYNSDLNKVFNQG